MNTRWSARSGSRSSLKKNLMPSASVWRMPNGPGPVGAEPVRHVGVELALEPDHEQHRHEQQAEGDHDLAAGRCSTSAEADVAGEERVEGEHQAFTTRTSVTVAVASTSAPTGGPGWWSTTAAAPRPTPASGTHGERDGAATTR